MNVPRRQITAGVFGVFNSAVLPTSVSSTQKWKTSSQDAAIWSNVEAYDQPYFGLICPEEPVSEPQAYNLSRWSRRYYGLVYFRRDAVPLQPGQYFQTIIDDVLDAIDAAFAAPRKGEPNTLGGIVQNCWLDGTIFIDSGILDQQVAIVVPVSIITGI